MTIPVRNERPNKNHTYLVNQLSSSTCLSIPAICKYFILVLFLIVDVSLGTNYLNGQSYLSPGTVSSYSGSKVRLEYSKKWANHSIAFGVQYLLNNKVHGLKEKHYLERRFYASKFTQHLGVSINYSYQIAKLFNTTPLVISYDFQFLRADLLGDRFVPQQIINGIQYYTYLNKMDPAAISLENNLCVGIELSITDWLAISQKLGGGIVSFYGLDKNILATISDKEDFYYMIQCGLIMRLDSLFVQNNDEK